MFWTLFINLLGILFALSLQSEVDESEIGGPDIDLTYSSLWAHLRGPSKIPEGHVLVEGDMLFRAEQLEQRKRNPQAFHISQVWPDPANIPYRFSDQFSPRYEQMIRRAIAHIEQNSCVNLVEDTANLQTGFILFQWGTDPGCYSNVGYNPSGMTQVNLDPGACDYGSIVHEVMHALGFIHEQARQDRDNYVKINTSMVRADFDVSNYGIDLQGSFVTPYDYDSIMHYPAYAVNGKAILAPKPIGQEYGLSFLDITELNYLYICEPSQVDCTHDVNSTATVVVGESFIFRFSVNSQGGTPVQVSYNLPAAAQAQYDQGTVLNTPTSAPVKITPTSTDVFTNIIVEATFTSTIDPSNSATCAASVFVIPMAIPLNCFGVLAADPSVCSGHGTCVLKDTCSCDPTYFGLNCELAGVDTTSPSQSYFWMNHFRSLGTWYDSVPAGNLSPATSWSSSMDVIEDWNLDFVEDNTDSFELVALVLPFFVEVSTQLQMQLLRADGSMIVNFTVNWGGLPLSSTGGAHLYRITAPVFSTIPKKGLLRIICGVNSAWLHGSDPLIAGTDDPTIGSVSSLGQHYYFRLRGFLRCKDGFFGPNCGSACPGSSSLLPAESQCGYYGVCKDGIWGDGSCTCFTGVPTADGSCSAVTCATFPTSTCPTNSFPVPPYHVCSGSSCTVGECCAEDVCAQYDGCFGCVTASPPGGQSCGWCSSTQKCMITTDGSSPAYEQCPATGWFSEDFFCFVGSPGSVDCLGGFQNTSECSTTCGTGQRVVTYIISQDRSGLGQPCPYTNGSTRTVSCNLGSCPVSCAGKWVKGSCSKKCGGGQLTSVYQVTRAAAYGGKPCPTLNGTTISQPCNAKPCPVECVGKWVAGKCSRTCGGGVLVSTYLVSTPAAYGGRACPFRHGATQSKACNTKLCRINCVGGLVDGPCSKSCGRGKLISTFVVTQPKANGGKACKYSNGTTKSRLCQTNPCR